MARQFNNLEAFYLGLIDRISQATEIYPRQFWFLFWGMLISATGGSMVWPFLVIYMRQRLQVPLTTVTLLLALNSVAGLVSTSIAGPLIDRFGRKGAMVLSLAGGALTLLVMSVADTMLWWAILMALSGTFMPLYRIGGDSMVADLLGPELRIRAYALLRTSANLGVAIGPAVGGFITAVSYAIAFYIAAGAYLAFALLLLIYTTETVPQFPDHARTRAGGGSGRIFSDRQFLIFCSLYSLAGMAYSLLMTLLPIYAKGNFGVRESRYGFIMMTNAIMVVLLQYTVTRITERYHPLPVLAVGSLFYALGTGSVAWGWNFSTFLISMVILTIGEMIMIPPSTAFTANRAPPEMRGRYMSVYGLTWGIAFGVGPVFGGYLNDHVAPVAIWFGGLVLGLAAALGFHTMAKASQLQSISPVTSGDKIC